MMNINPNSEIRNQKQIPTNNSKNLKLYDLEERTFKFAKDVRSYTKAIKITSLNIDDIKQLIRSSGSVGANYIEANEALGKKDFVMRIRISRKEAKESSYWLKLIECESNSEIIRIHLLNESIELMKIFSAIMRKSV